MVLRFYTDLMTGGLAYFGVLPHGVYLRTLWTQSSQNTLRLTDTIYIYRLYRREPIVHNYKIKLKKYYLSVHLT